MSSAAVVGLTQVTDSSHGVRAGLPTPTPRPRRPRRHDPSLVCVAALPRCQDPQRAHGRPSVRRETWVRQRRPPRRRIEQLEVRLCGHSLGSSPVLSPQRSTARLQLSRVTLADIDGFVDLETELRRRRNPAAGPPDRKVLTEYLARFSDVWEAGTLGYWTIRYSGEVAGFGCRWP